jgi:type IV pilus assembly protein PilY1
MREFDMNRLGRSACFSLALMPVALAFAAPDFTISEYPLSVVPAVKPNVMVILDNSQSMDGLMSGKLVSGDDPNTRGNIARSVLRTAITNNRTNFNWGLTTFATTGVFTANDFGPYPTYAYYLGGPGTMEYVSSSACVNGRTAGGLGCIPDPRNNGQSITYAKSGDDFDINDVWYRLTGTPDAVYGVGAASSSCSPNSTSCYRAFGSRNSGNGWALGDFSSPTPESPRGLSATDAGFRPLASEWPRQLWVRRGVGYYGNISGAGNIVRTVQADTSTHYTSLMEKLGAETISGSTPEIKNAALFTPLTGTLNTVREYFRGATSSNSPIAQTCQSNFVILATDGNPTGRTDGSQYDPSQWPQAQLDVFDRITALRKPNFTLSTSNSANLSNPSLAGQSFDIRTYVIGMGDSIKNPSSTAALNRMAQEGGAHPTAFIGDSPASIASAFDAIVNDIIDKTSTGTSAGINGGILNAGSRVYQPRFNSRGWWGSLLAYPVSSNGVVGTAHDWDAAARIRLQAAAGTRKIITYKPSASGAKGIPFRWPANPSSPTGLELDSSQSSAIQQSDTAAVGAQRLDYLRGSAVCEARNNNAACPTKFRDRVNGPLGDIVNSAPYYVAGPAFDYANDFETKPYATFANEKSTRAKVLYVGSNDGMLHAINATTGDEMFAYVPSQVYSGLSELSSPTYNHRFYVDGSPTVGDVFYDNDWHTLLVAGMRAGGKGVFALDVTDPDALTVSEGAAANMVRWEFNDSHDSDMGHVYSQPLLVRTNDGEWSVIVSGGYKAPSSSGNAVLFILNARTGAVKKKLDTGSGSDLSPNGLSAPAAIDTNGDGRVDVVYAGDLNGNVWKFNLGSATTSSWAVSNDGDPLFTTESSQPITGALDVTRHPRGGYLIAFGTGRYLATGDIASTSGQAIYAFRDDLSNDGSTLDRSDLQQQSVLGTTTTAAGRTFRLSTHAVDAPSDATVSLKDGVITRTNFLNTKKGWYLELPTSGERLVTDAAFRAGRLIVASMIPNTSCDGGGSGWLLEFDAITGNRLDSATFDTNASQTLETGDFLPFSSVAAGNYNVSGIRIDGIPATPSFLSDGKRDYRLVPHSEGKIDSILGGLGAGSNGRAMWREIR